MNIKILLFIFIPKDVGEEVHVNMQNFNYLKNLEKEIKNLCIFTILKICKVMKN